MERTKKLTDGWMPVEKTGHRPSIRSSIPTAELYHWMMERFPITTNGIVHNALTGVQAQPKRCSLTVIFNIARPKLHNNWDG